jgi:putative ABC transport system ATP-binding protein/lipoprotein-releasing system ATP-binding protein
MDMIQLSRQREPLVELLGVTFHYGKRVLFSNLDLTIFPGQSAAIVGATGTGKSTLLSLITGMARPQAGVVRVTGTSVIHARPKVLSRLRRREIGFVYQSGELLPTLTASENIALPAVLDGAMWPTALEDARVLMRSLGVPLDERPASTLSGGERQRTALARALINEPRVLIADEPTGSLDADTRDAVLDLMMNRENRQDSCLILVTHDPVVAARADTEYHLDNGRFLNVRGSVT